MEAVSAALGPIDGLVNGAGITRRGPAADFPRADWDRVLDVNLTGTFLCCQAVGRRMLARGRGAIVNVASIAGHIGLPGTIAYIAAKGGVVMLTRGLAVEWAPQGVRVNALAPSWFATDMGNLIDREPEYRERVLRRVPLGRLGRPEELVGRDRLPPLRCGVDGHRSRPRRGRGRPGGLSARARPVSALRSRALSPVTPARWSRWAAWARLGRVPIFHGRGDDDDGDPDGAMGGARFPARRGRADA